MTIRGLPYKLFQFDECYDLELHIKIFSDHVNPHPMNANVLFSLNVISCSSFPVDAS